MNHQLFAWLEVLCFVLFASGMNIPCNQHCLAGTWGSCRLADTIISSTSALLRFMTVSDRRNVHLKNENALKML
jgi:hypothetical protein